MNVISLIDNKRLPTRKDLPTEPGLAMYILTKEQQILFDTGMSGRFQATAQRLQVDIGQATLVSGLKATFGGEAEGGESGE